jgi:hypothetical protein
MTILTAALTLFACKEPKSDLPKKAAALTEEERDILKNREILENLELLQNFDKYRYFDLFAEKNSKKEQSPAKPATKRNERKEE